MIPHLLTVLLVVYNHNAHVEGKILWNGNWDSSHYTSTQSLDQWSWNSPTWANEADPQWKCYIAGTGLPPGMSGYVQLGDWTNQIFNGGVQNKFGAKVIVNSTTRWNNNAVRTGIVANRDFTSDTSSGKTTYFKWSIKNDAASPVSPAIKHEFVFFENKIFQLQQGKAGQSGPDNKLYFLMPGGDETNGVLWSDDFTPGVWHNFIVKIVFGNPGTVDLWYSKNSEPLPSENDAATRKVTARAVSTSANNEYHHEVFTPGVNSVPANEIIYFDGSVVADSAADVFGPALSPTPTTPVPSTTPSPTNPTPVTAPTPVTTTPTPSPTNPSPSTPTTAPIQPSTPPASGSGQSAKVTVFKGMAYETTVTATVISKNQVQFEVVSKNSGYVAIAFPKIPQSMTPADAVIGWDDGGIPHYKDYHIGTARTAECPDGVCPDDQMGGTDDILDASVTSINGVTTLKFTREINTGDSVGDNILANPSSTQHINVAIGSSARLVHHLDRESTSFIMPAFSGNDQTISGGSMAVTGTVLAVIVAIAFVALVGVLIYVWMSSRNAPSNA